MGLARAVVAVVVTEVVVVALAIAVAVAAGAVAIGVAVGITLAVAVALAVIAAVVVVAVIVAAAGASKIVFVCSGCASYCVPLRKFALFGDTVPLQLPAALGLAARDVDALPCEELRTVAKVSLPRSRRQERCLQSAA